MNCAGGSSSEGGVTERDVVYASRNMLKRRCARASTIVADGHDRAVFVYFSRSAKGGCLRGPESCSSLCETIAVLPPSRAEYALPGPQVCPQRARRREINGCRMARAYREHARVSSCAEMMKKTGTVPRSMWAAGGLDGSECADDDLALYCSLASCHRCPRHPHRYRAPSPPSPPSRTLRACHD